MDGHQEGSGAPGVPLAATDPFALEVHRAIEVPGSEPLAPLPRYVERAHDRALRTVVGRAAAGTSILVTLVGESSTGKSRACWEAARGLPDGWRLWHPLGPNRPAALLRGVDAVAPRTVIWLNDVHAYLAEPGEETSEHVAAALRTLLGDVRRAPVLVLATTWPVYWSTLTRVPDEREPVARAGRQGQHRELLTDVGVRLAVPRRFDRADLDALHAVQHTDPRLALAAAETRNGEITQFLAGATELLARCHDAPPGARALLDAAMDARRFGLGPELPYGLLVEAAEGYLTEDEYADLGRHWHAEALAYCTDRVRGGLRLLTRCRPRGPEDRQTEPRLRMAATLEQHGHRSRLLECPPASFWEAAARHVTHSRQLLALGEQAAVRLRLRAAAALYRRAADLGDSDALIVLAGLRETVGDVREAERLLARAVEAGRIDVAPRLAGLREKAADWAEAERLHRLTAARGHIPSILAVARLRLRAGDRAEAEKLYLRALDAGDSTAFHRLSDMRWRGDISTTGDLWKRYSDARSRRDAAKAAEARQRHAEASDTARTQRHPGDAGGLADGLTGILRLLDEAEERERAGDRAGAELLAHRAAEAGDASALTGIALARWQAGEIDEAERLFEQTARTGDPAAFVSLIRMREEIGDRAGAERLRLRQADAGHGWLLDRLPAPPAGAPEPHGWFGLEPDGRRSAPW